MNVIDDDADRLLEKDPADAVGIRRRCPSSIATIVCQAYPHPSNAIPTDTLCLDATE